MNKNFKSIITIMFLLIVTIFNINDLSAQTVTKSYINGTSVNIRKEPKAYSICSSISNAEVLTSLDTGAVVSIISDIQDKCGNKWYKISYSGLNVGYVLSKYVTTETYEVDESDIESYKESLRKEGFPESYIPKLVDLHLLYPNYKFKAVSTNLKFDDVVSNQSIVGKSLVSGIRDQSRRSTESGAYNWVTDTWYAKDGTNWFAANSDTVAYYLDPRNFLNESYIFQFEELSYNSKFHTSSVVQKLLNNTFMSGFFSYNGSNKTYASAFVDAAVSKNISPIHLAARSRQEVGNSLSAVTSGNSFTYNGQTYSGLYNFFNIGATSGVDNWKKGLIYANGGEKGSNLETKYSRPWTNPYAAISGGAEFLANSYINKGQNTLYFQKFNVSPDAYYSIYTHQYMTNIEAPRSESSTTASSYKEMGMLSNEFVFQIPVYLDMPNSTSLPSGGNPNNKLKNIKINNVTLPDFNLDKTSYTYSVGNATSVKLSGNVINSKASIKGDGTINLTNNSTTVNLVVTAQNGSLRTYTVTLLRDDSIDSSVTNEQILNNLNIVNNNGNIYNFNTSVTGLSNDIRKQNNTSTVVIKNSNGKEKTSGNISTGDTVTIYGKTTNTYTLIYRGDLSGDGNVTIADLLKMQKHILKVTRLSRAYEKAADTNKDGSITIADLLKVQKHILKASYITQ
ncbi:MAG: dockerin type I domain-containing protein [Bacilli bacterium]